MAAIDLPTSQRVHISYDLANVGERMLALLVDACLVGLSSYILVVLLNAANLVYSLYLFIIVLPLGLLIAYSFLCELLMSGQTVGKRLVGIQVVRLDGESIGAGNYLLRALFLFIDLFGSAGTLGGLLIASTSRRQRLGDLAAGTVVIQVKSSSPLNLDSILQIISLDSYQPSYPAVKQFSEADMLMLKQVLGRYREFPNPSNQKNLHALAQRMAEILEVKPSQNTEEFLTTLLQDYIVLTR